MNQGGQERRKVDTAVVLLVRGQCRLASASCTRLQPRQLHADAGAKCLGGGRGKQIAGDVMRRLVIA